MQERPIQGVQCLDDYVLEVMSEGGSVVRLNMKPFLHTVRFSSLKRPEVWQRGTTDGISVIWPDVAEMSYEEIIRRAFW